MSVNELARDLRMLERSLRRVLTRDSSFVFERIIAQLKSTRGLHFQRAEPISWHFAIDPTHPLQFIPSEDDQRFQPDIFCKISGPGDDWPFQEQEFVVRVWSLDQDLNFRERWDSNRIKQCLSQLGYPKRVLLRFHFEMANVGQPGPVFHLHFGGRQIGVAEELCWFPETIDIPRLPLPPLDLTLACELVLANFFHNTFLELHENPEWRALVCRSQRRCMKEYFEICSSVFKNGDTITLLKRLWNV